MQGDARHKFLFINPPTPERGVLVIRDLDRSGRKTREKTIWPQISLAYLATVMRDKFDVEIMDCIAEEIYWDDLGGDFEKRLEKIEPKYVLFNVISSTLTNDMRVGEVAKKNNAIAIAVGSHISALPEESLKNFQTVDFIIIGEAEETLKELVDTIEGGGDLSTVKGIGWRRNGEIVINEKRPLIENLDFLPIPLHELLPIDKYNLPFIGSHYTFVMSDRGCPYGCIFCRSPIAWNRKFRSRSAKSIIQELKRLEELNIRNFAFHSDVFTLNKERCIELCKTMIGEKLNLRWICNSRADVVDEELLSWMKKAGCYMVAYGFESGSQKVLDLVHKGITVEQIKKSAFWTHRAGIKVWGYFIIGLPGETWQTVKETIALAKELPLTLANFAVAAPYPGTDFYNLVKEKGWLTSDNWEKYDQNYSAIVNYPTISNKEIEKAMKMAYKEWYFRPVTILNVLKGIKSFNDLKIIFDVAWTHLKWMLKK